MLSMTTTLRFANAQDAVELLRRRARQLGAGAGRSPRRALRLTPLPR